MKSYILDTNFCLRFLLRDNVNQFRISESYIKKAKENKIALILYTEVIFEIEYVLSKVYKINRDIICNHLLKMCRDDHLIVPERDVIIDSLISYSKTKSDIADCLLFHRSQKLNAEVLTFDKHFSQLKKV